MIIKVIGMFPYVQYQYGDTALVKSMDAKKDGCVLGIILGFSGNLIGTGNFCNQRNAGRDI